MAATSTEPYSPFQQELLSHLSQINTNVNTLIQVFVNLQSSLISKHSDNTNSNNPSNNKVIENKPTNDNTNHDTNPTLNNQLNDSTDSSKNSSIITEETNNNNTKNDEEAKDEKKGDDEDEEDEDGVILSLDSSDTDDETNGNNCINNKHHNDRNPQFHQSQSSSHLSFNTKYKGFNSNNSWKHRSKFSLNRSKSTSSPSASMSTLLRANHIRNHKYNGILKNKYKKKPSYDQKSDSVVNNKHYNNGSKHNNKHNNGPQFNPEHVFLSKNNRIIINVGGSLFETTLNTLSADQSSMLSAMFSGRFKIERDENGSIFIDRDPTHFRHVLNFLRDGIEYLKHGGLLQQPDAIVNELLQEAKYYNVRPLVDYIQLQQTRKNKKKGDELTHEKQYKLVTNIGIDEFEDVFNKYTGSAGYDFEEWLYVAPYKTSRNSTSSPFFSMLFSKKLSRAEVRLLDRLTNIDFQ